MSKLLYIHKNCEFSRINGYGERAVVWTQGCSLKCKGCFNAETHTSTGGIEINPTVLGKELGELLIDGITITGGEPLDQPEAVSHLINHFRQNNAGTVFLFTGYSLENILKSDTKKNVILLCDAVIAGPYIKSKVKRGKWSNKNIIILNQKISLDEVLPKDDIEVIVKGSDILVTGYPDNKDVEELKQLLFNPER